MSREANTNGAQQQHAQPARRGAEARRQLQERLARFRGQHRTGMVGLPEVVALVAACALLAVAAASYFLLLVPARMSLANLETERSQLQTQIRTATENRDTRLSAGDRVSEIVRSLEQFETGALAPREASINSLYEELTEKPRRNGLARAQFSFVHQDEQARNQQQQQAAAANLSGVARRRQNIFPSTDITLNIEGSYANARRFIRDLERSRRFVVINGIQLEGINETGADAAARGALVTLRLDMSAYFRRGGAQPSDGATAAGGGASQ
ncbi:MAG TPA: GspMb/PilO family protein [Pyrinomonadaceae bacterium]|nr:GspMb/PilO family protein [Pyrinomonadaceae bacterium]